MPNIKELDVNGTRRRIDADPDRMLLSVLRDDLDLTGTKYGCGEGQCAACTVLLDGQPAKSCITRVGSAAGKRILTIEGLLNNTERVDAPPQMNPFAKAQREAKPEKQADLI